MITIYQNLINVHTKSFDEMQQHIRKNAEDGDSTPRLCSGIITWSYIHYATDTLSGSRHSKINHSSSRYAVCELTYKKRI